MHLPVGDSRIGCPSRTFQYGQDALARADQGEKPIERHIVAKQPARIGVSHSGDEEPEEFRSRAAL